MRITLALCLLTLPVALDFARPGAGDEAPSVTADQNAANWADREAQARVMDGDYDGAVQAQLEADSDRHAAARHTTLARSSKR
jgi:hypothetical protein